MSRTDLNTQRQVRQQYTGSTIVVDKAKTVDKNGNTISAVWHTQPLPDTGTNMLSVLTEKRSGSAIAGFNGPNRPVPAPVNGFSYDKWQLQNSQGVLHTQRPAKNGDPPEDSYSMTIPDFSIEIDLKNVVSASDFDAADRALVNKLLNKVKGQSINAAQAYAERRQTANTVLDAATTIANTIRAIKRGDPIGAAKALGVNPPKRAIKRGRSMSTADAAAHHWLSLQYGWKPLLNDVYGAAEALAKSQSNVQFMRQSASVTLTRRHQSRINYTVPDNHVGVDQRRLKADETVTIRIGVTYRQSSKSVATAKELGITNPALLAWELVPFSFVADWFLPVGNFLSSLDATLGLEFVSGYKTVFRKRSGSSVWDSDFRRKDGDYRFYRFILNEWQGVTCTRARLAGFPSARIPPFKNPLSVSHAVSAVALLHQLFRK